MTRTDVSILWMGLKRKLGLEQDQENLQRQFNKGIFATLSSLDSQEGPVDQEGYEGTVDL